MRTDTIQVAIVDDHQIVVEGLQHVLSNHKHIHITQTYNSGRALLSGLATRQPDVLLLDILLSDYSGEELVPIIINNYPAVRILAITSIDATARVRNLIRQGCLGYLLKNTPISTLVEAIETVYRGAPFIETVLKEQMMQDMLRMKKDMPARQMLLTRREKEILQLIALEYSSREIADKLFISVNTVENHRKHLFQKLDVKNLVGLMRKAMILGLVD